MATKDMLIKKQGLIPADILKYIEHSNACRWRHGERPGVLGVELPVLHVEKALTSTKSASVKTKQSNSCRPRGQNGIENELSFSTV